jgi:hypothetical protein
MAKTLRPGEYDDMLKSRYERPSFNFDPDCNHCYYEHGGSGWPGCNVTCYWHREWGKFWTELGRWVWNFGCPPLEPRIVAS